MLFEPLRKPEAPLSPEAKNEKSEPIGYRLPDLEKNRQAKKPPEKEKTNVFGEKGISRSKFREVLGKAYDPYINIDRAHRVEIEKKMPWSKYQDIIKEGKVGNYIKDLKKEHYKTPHTKDKLAIEQEIKLLEKLQKKK